MTSTKNQRKTNGHAGPQDRPNGHAPASTEGCGVPLPARPCPRLPVRQAGARRAAVGQPGLAASDDASGRNVASAAADDVGAGTNRENACAEVAPHPPNGAAPLLSGQSSTCEDKAEKRPVPPGEYSLPDNAAEFVEEIHRKIDLTEVWHNLLRYGDEKVKQRAVERLTDMLYKGAAASAEEQQIIFDLPRPNRD